MNSKTTDRIWRLGHQLDAIRAYVTTLDATIEVSETGIQTLINVAVKEIKLIARRTSAKPAYADLMVALNHLEGAKEAKPTLVYRGALIALAGENVRLAYRRMRNS